MAGVDVGEVGADVVGDAALVGSFGAYDDSDGECEISMQTTGNMFVSIAANRQVGHVISGQATSVW